MLKSAEIKMKFPNLPKNKKQKVYKVQILQIWDKDMIGTRAAYITE